MRATPYSLLVLLALFNYPAPAHSASSPTDSLKKIFANPGLQDTTRARAMVLYIRQNSQIPFKEKISLLDSAQKMAEKYNNEKLKVDITTCKVEAYREGGDENRINYFKAATDFLFQCQQRKDTYNIARAYYYRGDAFAKFDMLDKAIEEELNTVQWFEKAKKQKEVANANYLTGYYMFNNRQYKEALVHFTPAYKLWMGYKNEYGNQYELSGWMGNTYSALKKFDSALYFRYYSLKIAEEHNDKSGVADAYRYLGNIFQNMHNYDSAIMVYNKSLDLFAKIHNNARNWLVKYFLATVYYAKHDYHASANEIDEILDTVNGAKNFLPIYLATQIAGKVYSKDGQMQKSVRAFQKIIKFNDSIQASKDSNNVTEVNMKLQFGQEQQLMQMQQKQQAALADKDKERQAIIRDVLIVGFIGLLCFAGIMYRNFLQKKKANILLALQNDEITAQKKEIQDSINYARNIQQAILPDIEEMKSSFPGLFIFYKPKDVVSGDFYWFTETKGKIFIAAADCTGHGVPGAFMSMIGMDKLNDIVRKDGVTEPGKILSELNMLVKEVLNQNIGKGTVLWDGMDIAMLSFEANKEKSELKYSGAYRPLYIIANGKLEEVKPTKAPIGGHTEDNKQYEENTIHLKKGDCIYLTTDGYADQFGGEKGKKFTKRLFKELLTSIAIEPMHRQRELLEQTLIKWQGALEQIDDILIVGIQV